ncbi:MAG: CGNR zinc finger domain-containing protein [Kofleriaceae bacterium]
MIFAHDTEDALGCLVALVNEPLPDLEALDRFVKIREWTGKHERTQEELAAVRALRLRLKKFWQLEEAGVVALVNELLRDGHALPQLVKHDRWDYHIHATPSDAPLARRMAVEAAMAMVDLVRTKELARMKSCEADDCKNVFVDLTKNRSKKFCDAGCGNLAAVKAYRARNR